MIELVTAPDLAALEAAITGLTDMEAKHAETLRILNGAQDTLIEDVSELQLQIVEIQQQQQDIKDRIIETIVLVETISERQQRLELWLREKLTPKPPVEPTDQASTDQG